MGIYIVFKQQHIACKSALSSFMPGFFQPSFRSIPAKSIVNASGANGSFVRSLPTGQVNRPFSKRFANTHGPVPSKIEHLQAVPVLVDGDEHRTAARVLPEFFLRQIPQPVKVFAHVHRLYSQVDF